MQLISQEKPRTNVDAIIRFMTKGDIILNADQESLFVRICWTDTMLRSRKYKRDDILSISQKRFSISPYRANQDITDTHKVFGETRKLNKNYLISHHIDTIGRHIQLAEESSRLDLLAKLNDNLTYAINSIPPEVDQPDQHTAKIVYVYEGAPKTEKQDILSLLKQADDYIKGKKNADYIDYEPVTPTGTQNDHHIAERTADDGSNDTAQ